MATPRSIGAECVCDAVIVSRSGLSPTCFPSRAAISVTMLAGIPSVSAVMRIAGPSRSSAKAIAFAQMRPVIPSDSLLREAKPLRRTG